MVDFRGDGSMSTNDWDSTDFDAADDGFLSNSQENHDAVPEHTPDKDAASAAPEQPSVESPTAPSNHPEPLAAAEADKARRRQRGPLFWFGALAACVLLVGVIGGGIYWLSRPSIEEQAFIASPAVSVPEQPVQPSDTAITNVASNNVKHDPEAIAALFGSSADSAHGDAARVPSASGGEQINEQTMPVHTPKPQAERPEPKAAPATSTAQRSKPPIAKQDQPPKADQAKPKTSHVLPTTASPTNGKAVYVVQVFSSPSRDDADEWLQSLRQKNIPGGYITEQKIKGESWYRVRFGEFATRDAAEGEATRLGFREPWIARVR